LTLTRGESCFVFGSYARTYSCNLGRQCFTFCFRKPRSSSWRLAFSSVARPWPGLFRLVCGHFMLLKALNGRDGAHFDALILKPNILKPLIFVPPFVSKPPCVNVNFYWTSVAWTSTFSNLTRVDLKFSNLTWADLPFFKPRLREPHIFLILTLFKPHLREPHIF
jgi:hypothetical protein